jgi:hypothetical protein
VDFVTKVIIIDGAWATYEYDEHPESTDGTKEICERICGYKLIWVDCKKENGKYVPWSSQIEKRNEYLKRVPNNRWFIIMDSDEILVGKSEDIEKEFSKIKTSNCHMCLMPEMFPIPDIPASKPNLESGYGGYRDITNLIAGDLLKEINDKNWQSITWNMLKGTRYAIYKKEEGMEYRVHHSAIWVNDKMVQDIYVTSYLPSIHLIIGDLKHLRTYDRWRRNMQDRCKRTD